MSALEAIARLRESSRMCFACGPENPIGLKLEFQVDDGTAEASFKLSELYQGYDHIAHGGIVTTILDEAMVYAISSRGYRRALTTELNVRFLRPLRIGKEYRVRAKVLRETDGWAEAEAEICSSSSSGVRIAHATSRFKVTR